MTTDNPTVFYDPPAKDYPFTIEYLDEGTGQVLRADTIAGPGAYSVPHRSDLNEGRHVAIRITYPDGQVLSSLDEGWKHPSPEVVTEAPENSLKIVYGEGNTE